MNTKKSARIISMILLVVMLCTGSAFATSYTSMAADSAVYGEDIISVEQTQEELAATLVDGDYPRNSSGETYGSNSLADIVGYEPDLSAAVGVDGTVGYIRAEDENPVINSPEEALAYMEVYEPNRVIPLYDFEGNMISVFIIGDRDAETMAEANAMLDTLALA